MPRLATETAKTFVAGIEVGADDVQALSAAFATALRFPARLPVIAMTVVVGRQRIQLGRTGHWDPAAGTKQPGVTCNTSDIINEFHFEVFHSFKLKLQFNAPLPDLQQKITLSGSASLIVQVGEDDLVLDGC